MVTYSANMRAAGTTNNTYRHEIIVDLLEQDVAGNRSLIRLRQQIKKTSQYEAWNTNKTSTRSVSCTGTPTSSETFGYDFRGKPNGYIEKYLDRTFWVTHNADGTMELTISGEMNLTGMAAAANIPTKKWKLPTIPRASKPTVAAGPHLAGSSVVIYTNRAATSFTHTLKYSIGSASGTIATGVAASNTWVIPLALLNQIPNALSGTVTITCETYSGSTRIGTQTTTFSMGTPTSVVPSFTTITHSENVTNVANLVGAYVQGMSRLATEITGASGTYGSTITGYRIEVAGQVLNARTGITQVIGSSGTVALKGTVTDSRGRTASKTVNLTVLAYEPPKIQTVTYQRVDGTGEPSSSGEFVKVTIAATISSLNNSGEKNSSAWKILSRIRGVGSYVEKESDTAGLTISVSTILSPYLAENAFDFRVDISDIFRTTINLGTISTGVVTMHWGTDFVGIGKFNEFGALDVRGEIFQFNGQHVLSEIRVQTLQELESIPHEILAPRMRAYVESTNEEYVWKNGWKLSGLNGVFSASPVQAGAAAPVYWSDPITINFGTAFTDVPVVNVSVHSSSRVVTCNITSIGTTSFLLRITQFASSNWNAAYDVHWTAVAASQ